MLELMAVKKLEYVVMLYFLFYAVIRMFIFSRAGKVPITSLIPIYGTYKTYKIAKMSGLYMF